MARPNADSDLAAIRTRADHDGNQWCINGQKIFISNGQIGDLLVRAAKTDPAQGAHGASLLFVEGKHPGFSRG